MDGIFTLSGRFKDSAGKAIGGLVVIIYDEDPFDDDDVLGLGAIDADGGFRMSFARSEFEQDVLESEETPDLKVVAVAFENNVAKPVFARSFPDLKWPQGREDLGDLIIPDYDPQKPVFLEGVTLPDGNRLVSKLKIDDALVAACFAEVIPLVERHTGWKDVAKGLKVEVVDSLAPIMMRDLFEQKGTAPDSLEALIYQVLADVGGGFNAGGGLYDPATDTIVINRSSMEQNGIEFLKVILAHELVHAGQFRNTPGLAAYARDYNQRMAGIGPTSDEGVPLKDRRQYMVELEGYATYIEREYIRKNYYRMATSDVHTSFTDKVGLVLAWLASLGLGLSLPTVPPEASMEDKFKQYEEGVALWRSRAKPDQPAVWNLTVASLPGGQAFAPAAPST